MIKDRWDILIGDIEREFRLDLHYYRKEIDEFFDSIFREYSSNRFYHTIDHVIYMLDNIDNFKLTSKKRLKLEIAIWFHDVIYDSKKTDNEEKSGKYANFFLKMIGVPKKHRKEVKQLILITSHKEIPKSKLERIICDLDLLEFSEKWHLENSFKIRKEYSHLSDDDWNKGRKEFLEFMLLKKYIYNTSEYRDGLEVKTRTNLIEELNLL